MRVYIFLVFILFGGTCFSQEVLIDDFLGKRLQIDNGWAGESFIFSKSNENWSVTHAIHGSGISLMSTTVYDVQKDSDRQVQFVVDRTKNGDDELTFRFRVNAKGLLDIYCQGYKLAPYRIVSEEFYINFEGNQGSYNKKGQQTPMTQLP